MGGASPFSWTGQDVHSPDTLTYPKLLLPAKQRETSAPGQAGQARPHQQLHLGIQKAPQSPSQRQKTTELHRDSCDAQAHPTAACTRRGPSPPGATGFARTLTAPRYHWWLSSPPRAGGNKSSAPRARLAALPPQGKEQKAPGKGRPPGTEVPTRSQLETKAGQDGGLPHLSWAAQLLQTRRL